MNHLTYETRKKMLFEYLIFVGLDRFDIVFFIIEDNVYFDKK